MQGISGFQNDELKSTEEQISIERIELVNVIETNLRNFNTSRSIKRITNTENNENKYSEAFCDFMTQLAKGKFTFMREQASGRFTVDIGVLWNSDVIFNIEAKFLPTPDSKKAKPNSKTPKRDTHEYVYKNVGINAGIERFKKCEHGRDNDKKLLPENGMIAYIKEQDFDYWFDKINEWIKEAGWCYSEILYTKYPNRDDIFISTHSRTDGSNVILHHFWVKVV
ncbi:MAG: hypothetical protein EAZ85_04755 [Bacteroidetes bacterium]|nr:MAG: hypothetical protein EAZ85_04755 [Bacteroidota bacterium]TAG90205.1 MAG: hypothetical protein EAZ20_04970 [Bacteroidota bacterium]